MKVAVRLLVCPISLQFVASTFIIEIGCGTITVAVPWIATNFTIWSEAQLSSALVTIFFSGCLTGKAGMKRCQVITLAIVAVANLFSQAMQNHWTSSAMIAVIIGSTGPYFLLDALQTAIISSFQDPKTGASQFPF